MNKDKIKRVKRVTSPLMIFLLKTVALAGYAGVIIVAPNAVQAIEMLIPKGKKPKNNNQHIYYAKRSGYFEVKKLEENRYAITLTNKGSVAVRDILFDDYVIPRPPRWDGKWRVLSFDIAEDDRRLRDDLRAAIQRMNFKLIQNSVYVHPYPIDDFIAKLHERYPQSAKHVISMTATHIDGQEQLIAAFKKSKLL